MQEPLHFRAGRLAGTLATLLFLIVPCTHAAEGMKENPFFKALDGDWKGGGTFLNDQGDTVPVTNQLKAHFTEDGTAFIVEGKLQIDQNEVPYRWEYIPHQIEGLYAARYIDQEGNASDFDVQLDKANLKAKVTQISGTSGQGRIEMDTRIEAGKYHVSLKIIDSSGNTNLEGTLEFDRAA